MADSVRALEVRQPERVGECRGPPDLFVNLDYPAGAHHAQVWSLGANPRLDVVGVAFSKDDSVPRARLDELEPECVPVLARVGRVERELAPPGGCRVPVNGDARAVGPAV